MKPLKLLYASLFVTAGALCASYTLGKVDPYWLRSWNEAQKTRPEVMHSQGRIAQPFEPGNPLVIHGQVFEPDGHTPAADVVVHAYHRDTHGFDFGLDDNELTTWRLQGWVVTDTEGRFEFETIKPAEDHLGRDGPHVHVTLESKEYGRQWAPTLFFEDDSLLSNEARRQSAKAGEFGWVMKVDMVDGVQHVAARIRLREEGDF